MKTFFRMIFLCVLVFFDQWTKHLSVVYLKGQDPYELIPGVLEFRYLQNNGAAFSILQDQQFFFYILTGVFLFAAFFILTRIPADARFRPMRLCILVLTAGAIGNLIDRIVQKYVVDFIYFRIIDFPIFNVADIYVTLSVTVLVILTLFKYNEDDFRFLKRRPETEYREDR